MNETLRVGEIFRSIQGESTFAGLPCTFVRLTGCNLSCRYCDTDYAKSGGSLMRITDILAKVNSIGETLVEITGGEPLLQLSTGHLIRSLIAEGHQVLLETNGSFSIGDIPEQCVRIVDVKCPSSGECGSFLLENLQHLTPHDEIKFVIGSPEDVAWAVSFINEHHLAGRAHLLFSPVAGSISYSDLAAQVLDCRVPVRMQLQMHKIIWGDKRGV